MGIRSLMHEQNQITGRSTRKSFQTAFPTTTDTIAAPHVIMENPTGTVITDVIRFIVTANSLEVTLGNPRVPKGHYAFYGQKFPEEGAHLVLLKEGSSIIRQEDQVTYGVDGLVIYDE